MKLLVFITFLLLARARDLGEILFGEDLPTCIRSRDELQTECVTNYFENYIRPILVKGVPLEGYPGFVDPLVIEKIPITIVKSGLDIAGYATNGKIKGLGESIIEKVRYDYKLNNFEVKVKIPMLTLNCNYSAEGSKVLFFSLETKGKFHGTFMNVEADIRGRLDTHEYNGMEFALVNDMKVDMAYGSGTSVRLDPNDDGILAKIGVSLINFAPSRAVLFMFKSEIKSTVSKALEDMTNEILATLPLKLIFD